MNRFHLRAAYLLLFFATAFPASLPVCAQAQPTTVPQGETATQAGQSTVEGRREVKAYTLPPEKYEKAIAFSRTRWALHFLGVAYTLALLILILALRLAPRFRDRAEAVSHRRFIQAMIFVPLLLLTLDVLNLPLDVYRQHLQLRYDQSVQSWGAWLWDWTKEQLISIIIGTLLVWLLYAIIRRSKTRRWWLYFWLACLPVLLFAVFITPILIDPLFFRFEPLEAKQPALVAEIEKVVARGHLYIPRERMYEMNASEKFKTLNAYVTGFGATKRVVVWDTTIQKMTAPQTLFVFGHEMGHYVLGHIFKTLVFAGFLLLLLLFAISRAARWAVRRWGERLGLRGVDDWAGLPILMIFFVLFTFLGEPVVNTYSRYQEHEADVYGLEVTHGIVPDSNRAAAESFQILGEMGLSHPDPNPFIRVWLYSHPPIAERLKFAREYDPWSKGEPPQFVH